MLLVLTRSKQQMLKRTVSASASRAVGVSVCGRGLPWKTSARSEETANDVKDRLISTSNFLSDFYQNLANQGITILSILHE